MSEYIDQEFPPDEYSPLMFFGENEISEGGSNSPKAGETGGTQAETTQEDNNNSTQQVDRNPGGEDNNSLDPDNLILGDSNVPLKCVYRVCCRGNLLRTGASPAVVNSVACLGGLQ